MARMRTIKPGFFQNDILAEVPPLGRILFAGLWTIADRAGRLEDRPKRIKIEILPYDECNIDELLDCLQLKRFITRYEAGGTRYIQVINFCKHQSPHQKEPESSIPPEITELSEHQTSTVQEPDKPDTDEKPAPVEPPFNSNYNSNFNSNGEGGKNAPSRENPPPPPSANSPAIAISPEEIQSCWQQVFGEGEILGIHAQTQFESAGIENLSVFRRVLEIWKTNGHSIRNIAGMVERYGKELEKAKAETHRDGKVIQLGRPEVPEGASPGQVKRLYDEYNRKNLPAMLAGNGAA